MVSSITQSEAGLQRSQNHTRTVAKSQFAIDNVNSYSTLLAVIEYRPNTVSNG
jgi:hypothetical protein